ncbi:MAG: hypothetical protein IKA57_00280 [Clostridia bacterium]|nr:hypothetical protein [Clostridia bacterium]
MKAFKKLATLSMALLMALGVSAFAGCKKGGNTDTSSPSTETSSTTSEEKTYTCYEFVVLNADGTKVEGEYYVQLCLADGACINYFAPVTNGVCVYTHNKVTEPGAYVPHVFDAERTEVKLKETVTTSANAFGEYTLTLAK